MRTRLLMAVIAMALSLNVSAQERIFPNQGSAAQKAAMEPHIRATKALAQPLAFPTPSPTPEPSPTPTPDPSPNPPIAVFGTVTDEAGVTMAFAQVFVSYVNPSGNRETFQEARSDADGVFVATPYVWSVPLVGTELLVQATRYAQYPGDISYRFTGKRVQARSLNVDAGLIVLIPQLPNVWVETYPIGNDVFIRVRQGNTVPSRDYVSKVFTTAAASTALLVSDSKEQIPQIGRGVRPNLWPKPAWMRFSIPVNSPQGIPLCGWVQISSISDPSQVVSTEHGFCYNPTARVIGNW